MGTLQGFARCAAWLRDNLPLAQRVLVSDDEECLRVCKAAGNDGGEGERGGLGGGGGGEESDAGAAAAAAGAGMEAGATAARDGFDGFSGPVVGIISVSDTSNLDAAVSEYGVEILGRGVERQLRKASGGAGQVEMGGAAAAGMHGIGEGAAAARPSTEERVRYIQVEKRTVGPSGEDSTMVYFHFGADVGDSAGQLGDALAIFKRLNVNLSHIESRPIVNTASSTAASSVASGLRHCFFAVVDGHASDSPVAAALVDLGELASEIRVLGSYQKASALFVSKRST